MVRINLINPKKLADQHLIAEYNEILMLLGYVEKYPSIKNIPKKYVLGKGHIIFFKNKLKYIKKRFESIKKEMKKRGFNASKKINLNKFHSNNINDWKPNSKDIKLIKKRLKYKVEIKPKYYRYYGKIMNKKYFLRLLE